MPPTQKIEPLLLYYSKPFAVFVLAFLAFVTVFAGYRLLLVSMFMLTVPVGLLGYGLLLCVVVPTAREYLRALHWSDPVLVIDESGITDHREKIPFAAWDTIEQVYVQAGGTRGGGPLLCVRFRNAEIARPYLLRPRFLTLFWQFMQGNADWNLKLRPLRCSVLEVERVAVAFRRQSVARRARSAGPWRPVSG